MTPPPDETVKQLLDRGDHSAATALVIQAYGGEVLRFLVSRCRDPELASEAFATFSSDVHSGLPEFGFRSSVRTWVYAVAFHALMRELRVRKRDAARHAPLSSGQAPAGSTRTARPATPMHLRSEIKERMAELRQRLPEDDQLLLDLRVNRQFSWRDIATIMNATSATPRELETESARLRKRFQLVRDQLRAMALAEGLVPESNPRSARDGRRQR